MLVSTFAKGLKSAAARRRVLIKNPADLDQAVLLATESETSEARLAAHGISTKNETLDTRDIEPMDVSVIQKNAARGRGHPWKNRGDAKRGKYYPNSPSAMYNGGHSNFSGPQSNYQSYSGGYKTYNGTFRGGNSHSRGDCSNGQSYHGTSQGRGYKNFRGGRVNYPPNHFTNQRSNNSNPRGGYGNYGTRGSYPPTNQQYPN